MFFYLCMLGAAALAGRALYGYRERKKEDAGLSVPLVRLLLILALAVTFILYLPWFFYSWEAAHETGISLFLLPPVMIVRLMQTVSLDADYEAALEVMELSRRTGVSLPFLRFYAAVLCYVSVLVPLTGILTALSFFRNRIGMWFALGHFGMKKNFYLFNGVSERSLHLAETIFADPEKKRGTGFIFCYSGEEPEPDQCERIQRIRGWYSAEDPAAFLNTILRKRNRTVHFFLLEEEDRNFDHAVGILRIIEKETKREQTGQREGELVWKNADRVQIEMLVHSNELDHILDAREKYGVTVRIMDREQLCTADLFLKWPLFTAWKPGQNRLQVTVLGEGEVAGEILRSIVWLGQTDRFSARILYMGSDAPEQESRLRMAAPGLFDPVLAGGQSYDILFCRACLESGEEQLPEELEKTDYLVIAGEDDEKNIRDAMWLRTWFARREDSKGGQPFMAAFVSDIHRADRAEQLCVQGSRQPYDIHIFGTDGRMFSAEQFPDGRLAESLFQIQVSYHLQDNQTVPSDKEVREAKMELNRSVYNYRSTEANALYLPSRLFDSGALEAYLRRDASAEFSGKQQAELLQKALGLSPGGSSGSGQILSQIMDSYDAAVGESAVLESLSKAEHRRWISYMICTGWVTLPTDQLSAWLESHDGSHKDELGMRHACIVSWPVLRQVSELKTGGRDPEKYYRADREMVLKLRQFLCV